MLMEPAGCPAPCRSAARTTCSRTDRAGDRIAGSAYLQVPMPRHPTGAGMRRLQRRQRCSQPVYCPYRWLDAHGPGIPQSRLERGPDDSLERSHPGALACPVDRPSGSGRCHRRGNARGLRGCTCALLPSGFLAWSGGASQSKECANSGGAAIGSRRTTTRSTPHALRRYTTAARPPASTSRGVVAPSSGNRHSGSYAPVSVSTWSTWNPHVVGLVATT